MIGNPELAATPPVPAMVPLKYPAVVPVGAAAGRPLTGLMFMKVLLLDEAAAGKALKRTLGTTVVERPVEDEALSMTVLMIVFCTVV